MKKIIYLAMMLCTSAAFASPGIGNDREQTKSMLKRELEHHLTFPADKSLKNYDEAYIEISINNDGSIEVVNMNAANDDVRRFIEKQISQIHLNNTIGEDQTYVFRVCFRAS
jgi:Iap family predicted aminopeptidase